MKVKQILATIISSILFIVLMVGSVNADYEETEKTLENAVKLITEKTYKSEIEVEDLNDYSFRFELWDTEISGYKVMLDFTNENDKRVIEITTENDSYAEITNKSGFEPNQNYVLSSITLVDKESNQKFGPYSESYDFSNTKFMIKEKPDSSVKIKSLKISPSVVYLGDTVTISYELSKEINKNVHFIIYPEGSNDTKKSLYIVSKNQKDASIKISDKFDYGTTYVVTGIYIGESEDGEGENVAKYDDELINNAKFRVYGFNDVPKNEWYCNAVEYVYRNNIIKGYNEKEFGSNDKLTRGMLVTILYRMEGEKAVDEKSKFPDVQNNKDYFYKAVIWASKNNIISGYDDGRFGPNDNITREQMAVILNKYTKFKGKDVSATNDLSKYSDSNKISKYAENQVKWAVGAGVITGNDNGTLNPQGDATRAEVAAMMEKYCKKVGR